MSSELFMFENSFFSDPFSPFTDSHPLPFEILQEIQENGNPLVETSNLDQIANVLLSSSPPSVQLENLSISHLGNAQYSALEVKTEESQFNLDGFSGYGNSHLPLSFDAAHESAMKFMQRSYSSNCFEKKQNFTFRPQFDGLLMESHNLQNQIMGSPENNFSSGQMRRVCSTGDLQVKTNMQTKNVLSSSFMEEANFKQILSAEKSFMEEANFKVGRYTAEERKERIDRYRAKRTQRNFNKTIKYACRKTLADNRPRIRGRFARNDETGENPKASMFHYEDDLCIHGFYEEEEDQGIARREAFFNSLGTAQYPNYSYMT